MYLRRTFHVPLFLKAVQNAALACGFLVEDIAPRALPFPLLALRRTTPSPKATLHLSAGIHGDEPAGPLAILRLLRRHSFPADLSCVVFPLLNPVGMAARQRENGERLDINRDYRSLRTPEARAHTRYLRRLPRRFDLSINLHEDWECRGCYLYELNPDREQSLAIRALTAAAAYVPIDLSPEIDGAPSEAGIIRPDPALRQRLLGEACPESLYMIEQYTRHSYTFETPSNHDLRLRLRAHCAAVEAAFSALQEGSQWFEI